MANRLNHARHQIGKSTRNCPDSDDLYQAQIDLFVLNQSRTPDSNASPRSAAREENQHRYANTILLRTTGEPAKTITDLRTAVAAINPDLPLIKLSTIQDQVSGRIADDELISTLTTLFSLLALLLAAIGLYGVMSYNVAQRTTEIGVRNRAGSTAPDGAVDDCSRIADTSGHWGRPPTPAATRGIRSQLYGLSAIDAATFATAMVIVSTMTLLATWLAARRAAKVAPLTALRYE